MTLKLLQGRLAEGRENAVLEDTRMRIEERLRLLEEMERVFLLRMELHEVLTCKEAIDLWGRVKRAFNRDEEALLAFYHMQEKEHEPNIFHFDDEGFYFGTCSKEPPKIGRGLVYSAAYDANNSGNAVDAARTMGASLMPPSLYEILKSKGEFDEQHSVWLLTEQEKLNRGEVNVGGAQAGFGWGYYSPSPEEIQYLRGIRVCRQVQWKTRRAKKP